jgi:putative hemolysin
LKLSIGKVAAASVASLVVASIVMLGGARTRAIANDANGDDSKVPTNQAAALYCTQSGGIVELRTPWYGTNGSEPLHLAGSEEFCVFKASSDGSRIYVALPTLYTTYPSLAALAYYAEEAPGSCEGNPASCYCTLLGGSDQFGGTTGAGGGWVKKNTEDLVLEACIFPDNSTIDSWGLFYHSAGIIRGKDLDGVLRYANPYDNKKKK